ncbi:hypothetical protein EON82_19760 [bacterium]|nr:MAG: hypothetical protein EON82_19760 [bacterium]
MNRAYAILGLLVAAIVGFGIVTRVMGGKDDKTLIRESLRQSLEASRKGEPGGVLEAISSKFKFNDQEASGNTSMIANYIRNQKPDIEVTNQNPIVTGDEARITSPVKLKLSVPILGDKTVTIPDVVMVFQKETTREFLVFPVPKWRLTEVQAQNVNPTEIGIE